jgi:hypothetical protein
MVVGGEGPPDGLAGVVVVRVALIDSMIWRSGLSWWPPHPFRPAFEAAHAAGFRLTAHQGENSPAATLAACIDVLGVERIDHGLSIVEDPELVGRVAAARIPVTVCPTSNVRSANTLERLEDHVFPQMRACGLLATLNTDDPPRPRSRGRVQRGRQRVRVGLERDGCHRSRRRGRVLARRHRQGHPSPKDHRSGVGPRPRPANPQWMTWHDATSRASAELRAEGVPRSSQRTQL